MMVTVSVFHEILIVPLGLCFHCRITLSADCVQFFPSVLTQMRVDLFVGNFV